MTTHKEECEKNELILRQRQLIEKLTLENASLKAHIRGKVKVETKPEKSSKE